MARNMQFHLLQFIKSILLLLAVHRCCGRPSTEKCHNFGSSEKCYSVFGRSKSMSEASERCKNNSRVLLNSENLEKDFLKNNFEYVLRKGVWLVNSTSQRGNHTLVSPTLSTGVFVTVPSRRPYQTLCSVLKLHVSLIPCSGGNHYVICFREMLHSSTTSKSNVLTTASIFVNSTSFPSVGQQSSTRVPIIIGGVIGGVVVVAIVVAILVYAFVCRKSKGFTNQLTGGNSNPRAVSNNYEDCDEQPDLGRLQRQTRNAPPAYNVVVQNGGQNQNGDGSGLQPNGVVVGSHLYDNPRSPGASSTRNETN